MEGALLKSAMSMVVKEGEDASSALFDSKGELIAQAISLPCHIGMLAVAVPAMLEVFPTSQMQDGDVYIMNDPYRGGTHLPDVIVLTPIIHQGKTVALASSMAHHQDMGGKAPGSTAPDTTELYQEGLILPPLKLYDRGKPIESIFEIIRSNVRIPDFVVGDIRAQVAATNVGKVRILELFEEHGKDMVLTAFEDIKDYSEKLTRKALEEIPDGSYTFVDYLDDDGVDVGKPVKLQATITKKGSDIIVDFSGISPQVRGPINCPPSGSYSTILYFIRLLGGTDVPNSAGCFRTLTVRAPEKSIVNPERPAPCGLRIHVVVGLEDVFRGALLQAVPNRLNAADSGGGAVAILGGTHPLTGKRYVTHEMSRGGMGARPGKDGIDVISTGTINVKNPQVEVIELGYPVRYIKRCLYNGSGGAGEFRGGLGLECEWEAMGRMTVTYRGQRHTTRPWGVFGGHPSVSAEAFITRRTGEIEQIAGSRILTLEEGDRLHYFAPGGGGYGDPLRRKPESVLRDVIDRRVSLDAARTDYGVVIDPQSMTVDSKKTSGLRRKLRKERGPITWTIDRGPELGKE
jgi:N-methylhydantoinase B